jgi:hypothetical protein
MKLLKERTEPKRREKQAEVQKKSGMASLFSKLITNKLEKKVFKLVPPLKDYPEEIESDDSN